MKSIDLKFSAAENIPDDPIKKNETKYIPGNCNIGEKEITKRKIYAVTGIIVIVISAFLFQIYHLTSTLRLLLFPLIAFSILNIIQARQNFCVLFGINGVFNFSDLKKFVVIREKENLQKDFKKAWRIIFVSLFSALIIALIYYLLPL